MVNTKIQRWAILLAEYGATISYRKGSNNIRADMLSRIPAQIAVIDVEEPFIQPPDDVEEVPTPDQQDFRQDNIDPAQLLRLQKQDFPELFQEANADDSGYVKSISYYTVLLPQLLGRQIIHVLYYQRTFGLKLCSGPTKK